jgi:hypothetical protein
MEQFLPEIDPTPFTTFPDPPVRAEQGKAGRGPNFSGNIFSKSDNHVKMPSVEDNINLQRS